MNKDRVLKIFKETGALISGHFLLSSGLHSNKYIQCAQVFQYPKYTMRLAKALAHKFRRDRVSVVIGLAVGSVILAHEVAKAIGARAIFMERENGEMKLRRNFGIQSSDRALVVEDVVTTGKSVREALDYIRGSCRIVGAGAIVDRSQGYLKLGPKYKYLLKLKMDTYEPEKCSLCEKEVPLVKPGSKSFKENK